MVALARWLVSAPRESSSGMPALRQSAGMIARLR